MAGMRATNIGSPDETAARAQPTVEAPSTPTLKGSLKAALRKLGEGGGMGAGPRVVLDWGERRADLRVAKTGRKRSARLETPCVRHAFALGDRRLRRSAAPRWAWGLGT